MSGNLFKDQFKWDGKAVAILENDKEQHKLLLRFFQRVNAGLWPSISMPSHLEQHYKTSAGKIDLVVTDWDFSQHYSDRGKPKPSENIQELVDIVHKYAHGTPIVVYSGHDRSDHIVHAEEQDPDGRGLIIKERILDTRGEKIYIVQKPDAIKLLGTCEKALSRVREQGNGGHSRG